MTVEGRMSVRATAAQDRVWPGASSRRCGGRDDVGALRGGGTAGGARAGTGVGGGGARASKGVTLTCSALAWRNTRHFRLQERPRFAEDPGDQRQRRSFRLRLRLLVLQCHFGVFKCICKNVMLGKRLRYIYWSLAMLILLVGNASYSVCMYSKVAQIWRPGRAFSRFRFKSLVVDCTQPTRTYQLPASSTDNSVSSHPTYTSQLLVFSAPKPRTFPLSHISTKPLHALRLSICQAVADPPGSFTLD